MSKIFTPERQVELAKTNGNIYTYNLLDLELQSYFDSVQAIAHLAIAAPKSVKDPKAELSETIFFMMYSPGLRSQKEDETIAQAMTPLIFLDRYQKPSLKNGLRYFSAIIAAHEFEHEGKIINPETTASPYDFFVSIHDEKPGDKYEGSKQLGL